MTDQTPDAAREAMDKYSVNSIIRDMMDREGREARWTAADVEEGIQRGYAAARTTPPAAAQDREDEPLHLRLGAIYNELANEHDETVPPEVAQHLAGAVTLLHLACKEAATLNHEAGA